MKKIYLNLKTKIKDKIFYINNKNILLNTLNIKNSKKDKNVILIGTGKSASLLDPKKIELLKKKNFEIFSLGGFLSSELSDSIVIDYYLLSDERTIFPNNFDLDEDLKSKILKTIKNIKNKNVKLFLPTDTYKKHDFQNEIYYFNNNGDQHTKNITDITKYYGYVSISGIKALSACNYLGYSKIYFCGLDNDHWNNLRVNSSNQILQINRHYYDKEKYLENKVIGSVSKLLHKSSQVFKAYEEFKEFNIINLNPESLIDCFSKSHELDIYH